MKTKHIFISAVAALALTACGESNLDVVGMVYTRSDGVETRFAQSMDYNRQHCFDTIQVPTDDYRLYVMSDIHVDFSTFNLDTFVMDYQADPKAAPFCLLLGDIINGTGHYDYCMQHVSQIWKGTGDTCFCTLGNHDMYFDQWKDYRAYWKTSTYWFMVKTPTHKDLFICLDSGDGTMGIGQRKWFVELMQTKQKEGYRHIIAYTHTHFFKVDASQGHTSNFALEETYEWCDLFAQYGVDMVLQGHSHSRNLTTFRDVIYLRVDALEDHYYNAGYTILNVSDGIDWRFMPVGPQDPDKFEERVPGVPHL